MTSSYRGLQGVTEGYMALQKVAKGFKGVTRGYRG